MFGLCIASLSRSIHCKIHVSITHRLRLPKANKLTTVEWASQAQLNYDTKHTTHSSFAKLAYLSTIPNQRCLNRLVGLTLIALLYCLKIVVFLKETRYNK
jgi:hypothetical protein